MDRQLTRVGVGLLIMLMVGAALPPSQGVALSVSAARTAAGTSASREAASQGTVARQAQQMASGLTGARSQAARYTAVRAVMKALHVAIFEARTGKRLVRPGKNSPKAFYLYDIELRAMAGALGRKQLQDLPAMGQMLAAAGLTVDAKPLDAAILRTVLRTGTQDALSHPNDRSSLVPLLVRALGLRHEHPYDLAQAVPGDTLQFDAVQVFLIAADVLLGVRQQSPSARILAPPPAHVQPSPSAQLVGIQPAVAAADVCDNPLSDAVKEVMPFGKWGLTLIKAVSAPLKAAAITLDAIHGPMLAFSIKVYAKNPALQSTHYGPSGHARDAGKEVRFSIVVEMQDDLPDVVIACGPLLGVKFPKKGGVPGVRILWEQAVASLESHGTVRYEPGDRKTGADGVASLVFTPKDEMVPGFGLDKDARGVVNGVALYQSAFNNIPGSLAQFLVPKWAGMPWQVVFHKARGFKFEHMVWDVKEGSSRWLYDWNGNICGETPFGKPWKLAGSMVYTSPAGSSTDSGVWEVIFPTFGAQATVKYSTWHLSGGAGQPLRMNASYYNVTASADVTEDFSCPDNSQSP